MYTKQHFENLAQFVKNSALNKEVLASEFAKLFSLDNSKFKPDKFFKACGLMRSELHISKNIQDGLSNSLNSDIFSSKLTDLRVSLNLM